MDGIKSIIGSIWWKQEWVHCWLIGKLEYRIKKELVAIKEKNQ